MSIWLIVEFAAAVFVGREKKRRGVSWGRGNDEK
jgi:hypothetical protein